MDFPKIALETLLVILVFLWVGVLIKNLLFKEDRTTSSKD